MGEHRLSRQEDEEGGPVIPWWYWVIRFDHEAHWRAVYERRGHSPGAALALALMTLTTGFSPLGRS